MSRNSSASDRPRMYFIVYQRQCGVLPKRWIGMMFG
jgi:hypothetical protein